MSNAAAKHAGLLGIVGLIDVLLGLWLYWFLMDMAWIRSRAVPNLVMIAVGLLVCGFAVYQRRSFLTIGSTALAVLFSGAFVGMVFGMSRLPEAPLAPKIGQSAPGFTLANQDGQSIALADLHKEGPALLIFYRGHW